MPHVTVHCPHCSQRLKIGAGLLGQTLNCPGCHRPFETASPTNAPVRSPLLQPAADQASIRGIEAEPDAEPAEPWYYRAVFMYALPIKIAAATAAVMWALLPCLFSILPFVAASDISDAMTPATQSTPAFPRPSSTSAPSIPVSKTSFLMVVIYVVGFIFSFALEAVFLMGTFLLVDHACTSIDAARNLRRLRSAR